MGAQRSPPQKVPSTSAVRGTQMAAENSNVQYAPGGEGKISN